MRFILKGKAYELSREDVLRTMKGKRAKEATKYYVNINGIPFPPKQIIADTLGLGLVEFTTMNAADILRRLGFDIKQIGY